MTTILVTGANRGIGLEFARQYKAETAEVIACCRKPAEAAKLNALGVRVMELDLDDAGSLGRLAETLKGEPIDILINNAGIFGPETHEASASDYRAFLATFSTNSVAPLMASQALRANLKRGRDKKIVAITSKMGSISDSSGGSLAYRASKAALNMIMDGLAKDWAKDGIVVGILHPGWVKTDMGGPNALISVTESVHGMRRRIIELNSKNSGQFIDYKGRVIGW